MITDDFDLLNEDTKMNRLIEEVNNLDQYELVARLDEYQQLYWLRKSMIRVLRNKELSNRFAKVYAARNAASVLEAIKAREAA